MKARDGTCQDCGQPCTGKARCYDCHQRSKAPPGGLGVWNGTLRAEYGCIVTFENADGRTLTLHLTGSPRKAVQEACANATARDATYRVIAYSTPQTVLADIDGSRADRVGYQGQTQRQPLPEAQMLANAGLSAMLHPRLIPSTDARKLARERKRPRMATATPGAGLVSGNDALSEPGGEAALPPIMATQPRDSRGGTRPEASDTSSGSLSAPSVQLSLLPEWDGVLPVPYGVLPF